MPSCAILVYSPMSGENFRVARLPMSVLVVGGCLYYDRSLQAFCYLLLVPTKQAFQGLSCYFHAGLDGGVLEHQIETLDLPVDIIWLGSHLEGFVLNQTAAGHHILFFSWVPSPLTLTGNFTRILFPDQHHQTSTLIRHPNPAKSEFQV